MKRFELDAFLRTTRDGGGLRDDDVAEFVAQVTSGGVDDAQVGAWLMAARIRGLDAGAGAALLRAMADSGERMTWPGPVADKHSSGGIGDKVSFVLAPLLATVGVQVPMISGRALGHTGGTLDKLEAVNGVRVDFTPDELRALLDSTGCFIAAASPQLAPADARLYAVRDRTETVDSIPLIAASILSKKMAAGVEALVLDVKWGSAAFMATVDDAAQLARTMVDMAAGAGMAVAAAVTPMSTPLGRAVGNAAEITESLAVLSDDPGADRRLRSLCIELAVEAAHLAGIAVDAVTLHRALASGAARERFEAMCVAQGADTPLRLAEPAHHAVVRAPLSGPGFFDAHQVAVAASALGATRVVRSIDPAASILLRVDDGVTVRRGEIIAEVAGSDARAVADAADAMGAAWLASTSPWRTVETVTTWIHPDSAGSEPTGAGTAPGAAR
jgi:thymidine phosphorylase